jgi:hypothetical protein
VVKARPWICPRVMGGLKCGGINQPRTRTCHTCGKPRPARRRPKHLTALETSYEEYVEINGGEFCFICGRTQKPGGRRLHRDHDHRTGVPRGLLCFPCNAALRTYMTPTWLRRAAHYLERTG